MVEDAEVDLGEIYLGIFTSEYSLSSSLLGSMDYSILIIRLLGFLIVFLTLYTGSQYTSVYGVLNWQDNGVLKHICRKYIC